MKFAILRRSRVSSSQSAVCCPLPAARSQILPKTIKMIRKNGQRPNAGSEPLQSYISGPTRFSNSQRSAFAAAGNPFRVPRPRTPPSFNGRSRSRRSAPPPTDYPTPVTAQSLGQGGQGNPGRPDGNITSVWVWIPATTLASRRTWNVDYGVGPTDRDEAIGHSVVAPERPRPFLRHPLHAWRLGGVGDPTPDRATCPRGAHESVAPIVLGEIAWQTVVPAEWIFDRSQLVKRGAF